MPKRMRKRAVSTTLPEVTEIRVKAYSLAAAAAGVSLLALTLPAKGEVVVTHKTIHITRSSSVDLNNDGIPDFTLTRSFGGYDHSFFGSLLATPLTGGKVMGGRLGSHAPFAAELSHGAIIGGSGHFSSTAARGQIIVERSLGFASASTFKQYFGNWTTPNRFLGVKFLINGATHYGWIQMSVNLSDRMSGIITAYAYETIPDKKIEAGMPSEASAEMKDGANSKEVAGAKETTNSNEAVVSRGPSLGMLALGASGLAVWRRAEN
jgi:hypothetical protein